MGRAFSWRSLTFAVVLLVTGFEAITPDADDLASSMALRILGMQAAAPDRSSGDDDGGDAAGDPIRLVNTCDVRVGRCSRPLRQLAIAPIAALSSRLLIAHPCRSVPAADAARSGVGLLHLLCQLNC